MSRLSLNTIHLWSTKNFSFYARATPHAVKYFSHLRYFLTRYLRRLVGEIRFFTPVLFLVVLVINLNQPENSFERAKKNVQQNFKNSLAHFSLAQQFIFSNQYSLAKLELQQSVINSSTYEQMQKNSEELEKIEVLKTQPTQIKNLSKKWQKIIDTHPDYRDGYLQLAILNWKLYRPFNSQKLVAKSRGLDPNNLTLQKYEDRLK